LPYPERVSEHQDPRPRDDTDAGRDIARDLAEVAAQISTFKGEANAYLSLAQQSIADY
jgi:hypothetical protein